MKKSTFFYILNKEYSMRGSALKLDCNNEHLSEISSLIKKTIFELRKKCNMVICKMNVLGVFENDFI